MSDKRKKIVKKRGPRKAKKVVRKQKKSVKSPPKDKKLDEGICTGMTVKQIRKTPEYKGLTPLGKANKSGSYRYGNKSTMRKADLCRVLNDPQSYHTQIAQLKSQKKNAGPRKRSSRKGQCLVEKRKIPCNDTTYQFEGVTMTGEKCCYKKAMKAKTMAKRMKNAAAAIEKRNKNKSSGLKRGRPKKVKGAKK